MTMVSMAVDDGKGNWRIENLPTFEVRLELRRECLTRALAGPDRPAFEILARADAFYEWITRAAKVPISPQDVTS